jgi:hypothetical protein
MRENIFFSLGKYILLIKYIHNMLDNLYGFSFQHNMREIICAKIISRINYWANNKVDHNLAIQNIWSKLRPVMKKEKKKEKMYFKI